MGGQANISWNRSTDTVSVGRDNEALTQSFNVVPRGLALPATVAVLHKQLRSSGTGLIAAAKANGSGVGSKVSYHLASNSAMIVYV